MVISLTITENIPSIIFSVILLNFSNAKQLYKHICSVVHEIQKKYNCALWQRKTTSVTVHMCDGELFHCNFMTNNYMSIHVSWYMY